MIRWFIVCLAIGCDARLYLPAIQDHGTELLMFGPPNATEPDDLVAIDLSQEFNVSFEIEDELRFEALIFESNPEQLGLETAGFDRGRSLAEEDQYRTFVAEVKDRSVSSWSELADEATDWSKLVRLEIAPEAECRIRDQTPLEPFAGIPIPVHERIQRALYLDPDRALVATRDRVYSIDRGADGILAFWAVEEDPSAREGEGILDLAIDPIGGSNRSVVAVGGVDWTGLQRGLIWQLELREGSLALARSSSITEGQLFRSVAFGAGRRVFVGGMNGRILARDDGDTEFHFQIELPHRTSIPDFVYELRRIDTLGDDVIAGTDDGIHTLRSTGWRSELVPAPGGFESYRGKFVTFGAIAEFAGADYWAGTAMGRVARRDFATPWELVPSFAHPARFAPCLSGDPLGFHKAITAMEVFEDHVHLGYEDCNSLVVVRRDDQCVSIVPPLGQAILGGGAYITSIDRIERRLLIGTSAGELLETSLP